MFDKVKERFNNVYQLVEMIGDSKIKEKAKFLKARISSPDSYVVMLGETSSGKTTLLNGLLNEHVLHTSVQPSTACVVEIFFDNEKESNEYFAINKNATIEAINKDVFIQISKNPDENLSRLRLKASSPLHGLGNLRLFDTPGYGSIIDNHEEVLNSFIPESNMLVYVVSYKVGIQQDDFNFLRYAYELLNEDIEIVVVINRCPEDTLCKNDRRVSEIKGYVEDLLHKKTNVFLVSNCNVSEDEYPLPQCNDLWNFIQETISSKKAIEKLENSFNSYIDDLIFECETYIEKMAIQAKLNKDEYLFLKTEIDNMITDIIQIKDEIIIPDFDELIEQFPSKFEKAKINIEGILHNKIESGEKIKQDEITSFVTKHMLPLETKKQVSEIEFFIQTKVESINKKVDDALNKEFVKFQQTIKIHFNDLTLKAIESLASKPLKGLLETGINSYFKQFAGKGGTGIANGASHLLKKAGDTFGKTFSIETHNQLKHVLSKIGATSAKAVGIAVSVIIEALFMIVESLTWQSKLKKSVSKGINKWYSDVVPMVEKSLIDLKNENLHLLDTKIEMLKDEFSKTQDTVDMIEIEKLETFLKKIKEV